MSNLTEGRRGTEQVGIGSQRQPRQRSRLSHHPGKPGARLPLQDEPVETFTELRLAQMLDARADTRRTENRHHTEIDVAAVVEVDVQVLGVGDSAAEREGLASPHPSERGGDNQMIADRLAERRTELMSHEGTQAAAWRLSRLAVRGDRLRRYFI